jgi:hypothetical protein
MYCKIETQFKNELALIDALCEQGWTSAQIEIHQDAQNLFGYHGDVRKEKAHIIIRRKHIGSASNDLGFVRNANGEYEAIISQYDRSRFNDSWVAKLKQSYAFHTIARQQSVRGRTVTRERLANGRQRVVVGGYR